ncbi:SAM-dependent methyltransferase [Pedobacter ginsengisoli]|uniref:SAM-dependent methyltransferase n=1 Tax=Pedobacter ginsengisoli TaxID=363852 RepID=A0A2D1U1X0_9SPHI|nr:class I SAM-dependent methyltransferase [Pedobacter ginsengisoli]ATP55591.1 SAM-dependent methyltransferase [Pedobacter ginsengisoli]
MTDRKLHWENVYNTKASQQVSWAQDVPQTPLHFIDSFDLSEAASIIDIGGGDSKLVDHLLDRGYRNITVLDISAVALEKAKKRLGNRANLVKWIVSDIAEFKPDQCYDLWHDRATFHFLTTPEEIESYLKIAQQAVKEYLVIGTFSENGPKKCSGLEIKQYSENQLSRQLSGGFQKLHCITEDHITPFNTIQNFLFCSFKRSN